MMCECNDCYTFIVWLLVANGIGTEGTKALAASLEKNTALTTLRLSGRCCCSSACRGCKFTLGLSCMRVCCCVRVDSDYVLSFVHYRGNVCIWIPATLCVSGHDDARM